MSDIMIHTFSATSRRILICEDNRLIAMGWAVMLASAGYQVVGPVHGAEKALELAYKDLPDLALIDIALGGTIDGISVAAELAPLGTSVIFVTADYQRAAVRRSGMGNRHFDQACGRDYGLAFSSIGLTEQAGSRLRWSSRQI